LTDISGREIQAEIIDPKESIFMLNMKKIPLDLYLLQFEIDNGNTYT